MTNAADRFLAVVRKHMHHPAHAASETIWSPELESVSRSQLRAIQEEKLAAAYD